jgi:AcrR family transcriptional regulator
VGTRYDVGMSLQQTITPRTFQGSPAGFAILRRVADDVELGCKDMAGVVSRESYFETGLDVLSDLGYGGLKLAEVCNRLGVTTGSFYHYFSSWSAYTSELISHWMHARTVQVIERVRAEPDPRRRIDTLIQFGLMLPHGAEAAIRVWSSLDPQVYGIQAAVDHQRFDIMYESAFELLQNKRQAELFAAWGVYLLVGFEQATLARDTDALEWIAGQLLDALDSGRFASVPGG